MSILLVDKENEDALMMERTGLLNTHEPINELEETLKESVSDLPLGKALHLLVNIHGHIFDKAVNVMRESSPAELTLKAIEMPTVRALVSIENYLSNSSHVKESFKQVYDSLHEKFIKLNSSSEPAMRLISYFILYSQHKEQVRQSICDELEALDKKSQLAALLLIKFLFNQYITSSNNVCDLCSIWIPPLVHITEKYSETPTLLACTACDLALQLTRYIALHYESPTPPSITKIMEINDDTVPTDVEPFSKALELIKSLFYIMEKWQKPTEELERVAYTSIHQFFYYSLHHSLKDLVPSWDFILTYLTPKSILSKKPLTVKKQISLLSSQHQPISIILFILLQKGQLVELYGPSRKSVIYTSEQTNVKNLFTAEYNRMIQSFSQYKTITKDLILQLMVDLPYLCQTTDIHSEELTQAIIDGIDYTNDKEWMIFLCNEYPESSVCNLLLHVVHGDDKCNSSFHLLSDMIAKHTTKDIIRIIQKNVLSIVKSSNQACELLIQCMPYTHLPLLIQKLMALTVVDNEREKMTYVALISKALLQPSWASHSILVYLDLVRQVKWKRGFTAPTEPNVDLCIHLTPASIVDYKRDDPPIHVYEEQELQHICPHLMVPFQLWSSKVDRVKLESALKQLVYKTYALPTDETSIEAWKYLSFAFMNDHSLIWGVIEACLDITTSQPKMSNSSNPIVNNRIVMLQLNPMLILQTIPKEAFDVVKLPKSCIDVLSNKMIKMGLDPYKFKQSHTNDKHTPLCIQLMDQLSSKTSQEDAELQELSQFSTLLIDKIFC